MAFNDGGFRPRNDRNFDRGPRQMFDVTCSKCGKETQVPFKPREGRPVFCRECYMEQRNDSHY